MKTSKINLEKAFEKLRETDEKNLVSSSLAECCEAEIRRIHACSNANSEAWEISQIIPAPIPERIYDYDRENGLEIFSDGSLYLRSSGDSEVWASASDFLHERLELNELNLGERELFFIIEPEDSEAADFVVNIRSFFNDGNRDSLASSGRDGILRFSNRDEAEKWVKENTCPKDEIYRLAHNESSRPQYSIIACD